LYAHAAWLPLLASAFVLSACGSSPSKDDNSKVASAARTDHQTGQQADQKETKKSRKRGDKEAEVVEEVPAGPPPIPPEAMQRFERALTLLSAGDLAPAGDEFQRLAEAYPDYSGPMVNLGIVQLKSGKLQDAEKTLLLATQRGEPNAAAFNQLGIVYRQLGKFKEADAAYSRALTIDTNYALAHLNLGVLCDMYLDDPQRALASYESYLRLAPNPDARVTSWTKELRSRLGIAEPRPPEPSPPAPSEASSGEATEQPALASTPEPVTTSEGEAK